MYYQESFAPGDCSVRVRNNASRYDALALVELPFVLVGHVICLRLCNTLTQADVAYQPAVILIVPGTRGFNLWRWVGIRFWVGWVWEGVLLCKLIIKTHNKWGRGWVCKSILPDRVDAQLFVLHLVQLWRVWLCLKERVAYPGDLVLDCGPSVHSSLQWPTRHPAAGMRSRHQKIKPWKPIQFEGKST